MMDSGIVVAVIASVGAFGTSAINALTTMKVARITHANKIQLGHVREQVQNSHSTNLRDDVDELKDSLLSLHERLTQRYAHADKEHDRIWRAIHNVTR